MAGKQAGSGLCYGAFLLQGLKVRLILVPAALLAVTAQPCLSAALPEHFLTTRLKLASRFRFSVGFLWSPVAYLLGYSSFSLSPSFPSSLPPLFLPLQLLPWFAPPHLAQAWGLTSGFP